ETNDLVLDGRTVPRANTLNLPTEERRSIEVGANQRVGGLTGVDQEGRHLRPPVGLPLDRVGRVDARESLLIDGGIGPEAKVERRLAAVVGLRLTVIDTVRLDSRRRAGL